MAIMDQAVVSGKTIFFPQSLKRVYSLEAGQTIHYPNGWQYTALVMNGESVEGYCYLKKPGQKEIDSSY